MASLLKVDALTGVTTAGSISVTGEGNSTTTNLQQGLAKAWILFDGTGTIAISDSFSVSSISDGGTGYYTVTVSNAFSDANYCVSESLAGSSAVCSTYNNYTMTSTAYQIGNRRVETTAFHDAKRANESFFGDLA